MSPEVLYLPHSHYPNLHSWSLVLGLLGFILYYKLKSWLHSSYHPGLSRDCLGQLLPCRNLCWVTYKLCWQWLFCHQLQQNKTSPSTSFLERSLQPGQTLSLSYAVLQARTEMACWYSESNQMHRSTCLLMLVCYFPLPYLACCCSQRNSLLTCC